MASDFKNRLDGLSAYIDGKMKRYSLLFSVNGGAFAIAQLAADVNNKELVGGITLQRLALGAIVFTVLMAIDIWNFGEMMRTKFFGGTLVFTRLGKAILLALTLLLIGGWLLAAFG